MMSYWLINPFSNHIFTPFALILLALFVTAALALFAVQRVTLVRSGALLAQHGGQASATLWQVLWQRYRTWVLIAILFASASFSGLLPMALLCAFVCWQGSQEYAALTNLPLLHRTALVVGSSLTLATLLLVGPGTLTIAPIVAFFACSLLSLLPRQESGEERAMLSHRFSAGQSSLWGYFYLGWLPAFLLALSIRNITGLVMLAGMGVAMSDVGAFCAGKLLGGAKLAPLLSPNKTWGGVLGNLIGASLAVLLVSFALPALALWQYCLLAIAIGLGSVLGDLLESLLKRQRGVKDAGNFLPGFGGVLDRIDSLLLVAPLVYYLSLWFLR